MPSLGKLPRRSSSSLSASPSESDAATMKRRKSSVSSLKAIPLPFRSKRKVSDIPATHTEHVGTNLLSLPTELQLQILQHCSFADLCALRATSRDVNLYITGPDSAIAKFWINSKLNNVHRLYPPPAENHWNHVTAQMHRWNVARHLAEMIAYNIQYKTLLYVQRQASSRLLSSSILAALLLPAVYAGQPNYHSAQKNVLFFPVALRIRRKMTPLLFVLSHYLSTCQHGLLNSQIAYSLSGEPIAFWNGSELPERYACYSRDQLFSSHYCWLFLEWIFNIILSRPSYAGAIERRVRGWNSTPLDGASLSQVLVHGNLTAVKQLMRLKDYGERKKWAKNFIRSLNPEQNPLGWFEGWKNLDMRHGEVPRKAQATAIMRGPEKADSLWTRGAARRLQAQGIELEENELHGSSATTMRFLTDMAGFDLFHDSPPLDIHEDSDSETESLDREEQEDEDDGYDAVDIPRDENRQIINEILEGEGGGVHYWDV